MKSTTRRNFLVQSAAVTAATLVGSSVATSPLAAAPKSASKMSLGLCTYLWGKDWDLPTVIANCEKSGCLGVELRTEHAHGVEISLNAAQRKEVRKRFADSQVEFLGPGCNWQFHEADPAKLKANIEGAKAYLQLSHDCGGSGVKVKPNALPKDVPVEKTIEQIGNSLNEVAKFGANLGQQVRVEVHGKDTSNLPIMKQIFDVATHPNATICWNSNGQDLEGEGLEHNFNLVRKRFGNTVHIREMNVGKYPYKQLMKLFVQSNYSGWILLECRTKQEDRVAAMIEQREILEAYIKAATT
ncbi:MAG: xylose isomerase [Blastopirellula sp.]|nr:MAG: xylose isomerase [Blastopirellula sp.]